MPELSLNHAGEQTLTVSTAAVALTPPAYTDKNPDGTTTSRSGTPSHALIYVGGSAVRFRADGTDPTSTAGMFIPAGSYIDWTEPMTDHTGLIARVKFIRDTTAGADATLEIAYMT